MIDVDYFKIFNDTYGHVQGDECLKIIAKTLKSTVNRSTDLTARLGGEEFSVLLPDTDEDGGKSIATKILESISALKIPNENSKAMPYVTVSIGICSLVPTVNCEAEDFIHAADMALYSAKESGRNRFQVFNNVIGSKNSINEDLELWKKIEGMAIDK
ncbi:Phytochrome-like protein cph2 [bioreactor metagenome]|uniref:Phytochrome-like protein cph2 n=1 Tax=bioreactor metagenome TaxID=1076179 RepID=A0A644YVT0_9ZZZZ